ncbi:MAG: energy transducer TonB [Proteobacteria bacterium]|nr:energy transducer TonB [Pseudomonadota bacterium]HQR05091.1 energy transducer TonB [Rhodocyclaceae bacterium]
MQAPLRSLVRALILSLLLHGVLVLPALWHDTSRPPPAPPRIEVHLREAPVSDPLLKNTLETDPTPPEPPAIRRSFSPDSAPKPATPRHPTLAAAQRKLAEHLYYPAEAIARGWEGETRLLLTLAQDGTVQDADVAASSGHVILDQAAQRAAYAMGRIDAGGQREMILPVMFQLR